MEQLRSPFPMVRTEHRVLESDFSGPVFIWDIDKTYLETRFSKFKDLVKIPLEFAVDKRAVPGVIELLHGVRAGPDKKGFHPIYFVSASPGQIHTAIERKMLLDGVQYDGITFKDWGRVLRRRQFSQFKNQMAYKLSALLVLVRSLPPNARLFLFGDDAEHDALIYSVFADIMAGHLRGDDLNEVLSCHNVPERYRAALTRYVQDLPKVERVERVFIRLFRCPDGASIRDFDSRIMGWPTSTAAADELIDLGLLHTDFGDEIREKVPLSSRKYGTRSNTSSSRWT